MPTDKKPKLGHKLGFDLVGVWWLLSREDFTHDGNRVVDPSLGDNPLGILTYAPDKFAAQFMKQNRSDKEGTTANQQGQNNTGAISGYDAYFGTYRVYEQSGEVIHCLEGALTLDNVGLEVARKLQVNGDQLIIKLDTTTAEGEPISRTLTWRRIG